MLVEIDGSALEGGGQILRTAIAFSAVLKVPIIVKNIRAKRKNPGLRPQHLQGILALQQLTDAEVKGAHIGSNEISFTPRSRRGGPINIDIGTAGAITLILQALMLIAPFCSHPVIAHISGGTNVAWSPPIDYLQNVLLPRLSQMDYSGSIKLEKRGYYPRGGGHVVAHLRTITQLYPITLVSSAKEPKIVGISHCGALPQHVASRQAKAATQSLRQAGIEQVNIQIEHHPTTACPGSGISLWTLSDTNRILGSDGLGRRGLSAEKVGQQGAETLLKEIKTSAPVDRFQADMLIPYIALAKGQSTFPISELTQHTITNIHVVEKFLDVKFDVKGNLGLPAQITVDGVGLEGFSTSLEPS
ncbi:MAG: RNA 3'-terminal phosphate cyclase [Promethearchaeota archaeon]